MTPELGFLVGIAGLAWWAITRHREAAERKATCRHERVHFVSAWNEGRYWSKHCPDCGHQEQYKTTWPARSHPDNPLCFLGEGKKCECRLVCVEERRP